MPKLYEYLDSVTLTISRRGKREEWISDITREPNTISLKSTLSIVNRKWTERRLLTHRRTVMATGRPHTRETLAKLTTVKCPRTNGLAKGHVIARRIQSLVFAS